MSSAIWVRSLLQKYMYRYMRRFTEFAGAVKSDFLIHVIPLTFAAFSKGAFFRN